MSPDTVATPHLLNIAAGGELEDWGPLEEATDPDTPMQTAGYTLWNDGEQEVGIWECTAGPSYWKLETHEEIYIISGRMTVTVEGGEPLDVGAGDAVVFPKGWAGTWQIHETLRKLYVIF
ncbi:MAG TPA: cupin domain-containing protein [Mycobacteriales bacterium]|nr:cupin domain-containing protein [Mycobacteriales bacterium]